MKLTGIVAAAALFATNVIAQSSDFNLTALNGTWYAGGLTKSLFRDIRFITRLFNATVTCPQVYITGNSSDTIYIQPSLQVGWWNASTRSSQKMNVSMSGLLTLENGSQANNANFTGQFSYLNASKSTTSNSTSRWNSNSNALKMLDVALAGLNVKNPLPQGPALEANVNIQIAPGSNGTNVVLISASNFTFPELNNSSSGSNGTTGNSNGTTGGTNGTTGGTNGTDSNSNVIVARADESATGTDSSSGAIDSSEGSNGTITGDSDSDDDEDDIFQVLLVQNATTFDTAAYESSTQAFGDFASNITRLNNTCSGTGSSSATSSSATSSAATSSATTSSSVTSSATTSASS